MSRHLSMLDHICMNSAKRVQNIPMLAARCEDTHFTGVLRRQWQDCCEINEEARKIMSWKGTGQTAPSELLRLSSHAATNIRTLTDRSVSRLAELRIQDSTQGIADMTRILHQTSATQEERRLAEKLLSLEESHVKEMKEFL